MDNLRIIAARHKSRQIGSGRCRHALRVVSLDFCCVKMSAGRASWHVLRAAVPGFDWSGDDMMKIFDAGLRRREVTLLTAMALGLAGCGGGGGFNNVKPAPIAPPPPPTTPTDQPPPDAQLVLTHADVAHQQGYT